MGSETAPPLVFLSTHRPPVFQGLRFKIHGTHHSIEDNKEMNTKISKKRTHLGQCDTSTSKKGQGPARVKYSTNQRNTRRTFRIPIRPRIPATSRVNIMDQGGDLPRWHVSNLSLRHHLTLNSPRRTPCHRIKNVDPRHPTSRQPVPPRDTSPPRCHASQHGSARHLPGDTSQGDTWVRRI